MPSMVPHLRARAGVSLPETVQSPLLIGLAVTFGVLFAAALAAHLLGRRAHREAEAEHDARALRATRERDALGREILQLQVENHGLHEAAVHDVEALRRDFARLERIASEHERLRHAWLALCAHVGYAGTGPFPAVALEGSPAARERELAAEVAAADWPADKEPGRVHEEKPARDEAQVERPARDEAHADPGTAQ